MKERIKYHKYLDKRANEFRLTGEDLSNLFDLSFIIDTPSNIQIDIKKTLELNRMNKWFNKFFGKIQEIVLEEDMNERD